MLAPANAGEPTLFAAACHSTKSTARASYHISVPREELLSWGLFFLVITGLGLMLAGKLCVIGGGLRRARNGVYKQNDAYCADDGKDEEEEEEAGLLKADEVNEEDERDHSTWSAGVEDESRRAMFLRGQ